MNRELAVRTVLQTRQTEAAMFDVVQSSVVRSSEVVAVYNSLKGVEVADQMLQKRERCAILSELASVILDHHCEDVIGIRLLHRHSAIACDEIMLEREETDVQNRFCLSTIATPNSECLAGHWPNSWKLHGSQFVPLEYSVDPLVAMNHRTNGELARFFDKFADVLRHSGGDDLLGPWVVPRSFYRRPRPSERATVVETCDDERRANVLRFADLEEYRSRTLIATTWVAKRVASECSTYCAEGACAPHSACVIGPDGHSQEEHHSTSHTTVHGAR